MLFKNKKRTIGKTKIAYLLEDTSLCGGVKTVFDHARLLSERDLSVTIFAKGQQPPYYNVGTARFIPIDGTFPEIAADLLHFDIVIATFYTQLLELHQFPINLVHFSQGYEAGCSCWEPMTAEIEKAYRLPIPKITVSKIVASLMEGYFSQPAHYIPHGIDLDLFQAREAPDKIEKIIVVGNWENEIKGIKAAVKGFSAAKKKIDRLKLVRVSSLPLSDEERSVCLPDEYHTAVHPDNMAKIYRQCDLAVVPSLEGEGFGLPAIEAMASGLPVMLTKIHSFLSLQSPKDYAYFVSPDSPEEIAEAIIHLCERADLALRLGKRAREVAEGYPIGKSIEQLIEILRRSKVTKREQRKEDIAYIYVESRSGKSSMEVDLLRALSKKTFSGNNPMKIIVTEYPTDIKVGEILKYLSAPLIAICLDDTTFFSEKWLQPLKEALDEGFELASTGSSDSVAIDLPYYSPLTFNDVAARTAQKYRGQHLVHPTSPPSSFLVKRRSLERLDSEMRLPELPSNLKSALVQSSLVHRFGDYYSSKRDDILPYVPYGSRKVLDIGCAKGFFGELIKKERGCEVIGVEIDKKVAMEAKSRLDDVFCVNIENAELPFNEDFDVIIFADILEHLYDPWRVLANAKKWLRPDGIIIASIPNTAHYSIIIDLLRGRWDYIPFGLLCITHLRFFTRASIESLFSGSGYSILNIKPQDFFAGFKEQIIESLKKFIKADKVSEEILNPGYYVVGMKK